MNDKHVYIIDFMIMVAMRDPVWGEIAYVVNRFRQFSVCLIRFWDSG